MSEEQLSEIIGGRPGNVVYRGLNSKLNFFDLRISYLNGYWYLLRTGVLRF